jgi:hypothetical protein
MLMANPKNRVMRADVLFYGFARLSRAVSFHNA